MSAYLYRDTTSVLLPWVNSLSFYLRQYTYFALHPLYIMFTRALFLKWSPHYPESSTLILFFWLLSLACKHAVISLPVKNSVSTSLPPPVTGPSLYVFAHLHTHKIYKEFILSPSPFISPSSLLNHTSQVFTFYFIDIAFVNVTVVSTAKLSG